MDKRHVVIARLDEGASEKILRLQRMVAFACGKAGPEWPPHITLAAYENLDEHAVLAWTEEYARMHEPLDVLFPAFGVFGKTDLDSNPVILYAAPASSREFMDFYYGFHAAYDEQCGEFGWLYSMKYGYPVPHATLGIFERNAAMQVMQAVLQEFLAIHARIIALEVQEYPMKLMATYSLGIKK